MAVQEEDSPNGRDVYLVRERVTHPGVAVGDETDTLECWGRFAVIHGKPGTRRRLSVQKPEACCGTRVIFLTEPSLRQKVETWNQNSFTSD